MSLVYKIDNIIKMKKYKPVTVRNWQYYKNEKI